MLLGSGPRAACTRRSWSAARSCCRCSPACSSPSTRCTRCCAANPGTLALAGPRPPQVARVPAREHARVEAVRRGGCAPPGRSSHRPVSRSRGSAACADSGSPRRARDLVDRDVDRPGDVALRRRLPGERTSTNTASPRSRRSTASASGIGSAPGPVPAGHTTQAASRAKEAARASEANARRSTPHGSASGRPGHAPLWVMLAREPDMFDIERIRAQFPITAAALPRARPEPSRGRSSTWTTAPARTRRGPCSTPTRTSSSTRTRTCTAGRHHLSEMATDRFEHVSDDILRFVGAEPDRRALILLGNTTQALDLAAHVMAGRDGHHARLADGAPLERPAAPRARPGRALRRAAGRHARLRRPRGEAAQPTASSSSP